MKDVFEELEAEVAQYALDRKHDAIKLKNLLIANDNLIAACLSQEVFCVATNSEVNVARFTEMHVANTTVEARCLALEAELDNLRDTNNHDNQKELINHFSKLEVNHLNLQLKYQNLKDSIGNNPPTPDKDTPDLDSVFVIGKMQAFLQGKDNVIRRLKKELSQLQVTHSDTDRTLRVQPTDSQITKLTDQVTHLQAQNDLFRAKNDKIKKHYKELYDSIKITRTKHIKKVTKLTTKNVNLKTSVSKATVNLQVSARDKHAIDVEPIVPRLRNNRDAHLDYLRHLKESSQQRAKQLAYIPLIMKKQVTVSIPSDKSDSTAHPHVVTVKSQKTNVPVPPSTRVNSCPNASGSQPKSHVKLNRISPTKGVNKLPVEDQPRTNKSHLRTSNRADSSRKLVAKKTAIPNNGAFTASSTIPSIYIQQFWDTILYDKKARCYSCQLDKQWFVLTKETLKEALHITLVNNDQALAAPPSIDGLINFVNQLGYPKRHRFYPRPDFPLHLANEEPVLGYLKFSVKGMKREVFGMPIPGSLITAEIQQASYYREYLAKVAQHRSKKRSRKNVEALKTEEVPTVEPRVADEDAEYQKVLEESMKDAYALPKGTLPPVVIREPESGKYQPLPDFPGKGKAKVTEEQVAQDLLSLQKHKKTSPAYQYIFQRRVSEPTGSSEHDESPYALLGQSDSEEESKKVVLRAEEGGQDEGHAGLDPNAQAEDQTGSDAGAQAEDQTLAGPDLGDAKAKVQSITSHVVHAGSNREHMDPDVANVSPQPSTEQLDEGFTATAYPKTSPIIDLFSRPESPKAHQQFKATTTDTTTTTLPPPQAPQQSTTEAMMVKRIDIPQQVSISISEVVTDAVDWAMQAPLRNRFRDLLEADMKEILHQRMWESESYKSHEDHMQLFKALEKSMNRDHSEELVQDLAEARKKKKKSRESPKTPPGLHLISHLLLLYQRVPPKLQGSWSFWISLSSTINTSTVIHQPRKSSISLTLADLEMDEDMAPNEQAQSSDDKDIRSAHILTTGDIATFMDWFCKRRGITELKPQDLEGPAYEIIKVFHPDVIHLQYKMEECHKLLNDSLNDPILRYNVSKPLPLGGPPGQVIIQSDFFFNKDLKYLRFGSKGHRPALSISKMKAAYYPDARLEQMVPNQFWIEEECKYDIAAMYGISHWWFQRQRFYIDRHTSEDNRSAVRTHMRILSVVRKEVFSMYGYDYMKKIVLRRADLNEYVIPERDFKQLVIRQRVEDFQLGIESYQTQLNLTKPQWDATSYKYKHDYTVIDSPRAAIFRDKYGVQMMMCVNEIHKFSNGTLQQIDEALDYKIKEFKINRMNTGLNTRFWTRKDVDRSKAFMFAIQRRLKRRRIFRSLESIVDGRVREGDYRLLKRTE
nr:integrase, catalytic region, zinc finger, CCHC-type, peptidase aspartic, catalytic [Tanacetum cinerariifolium]